MIHLDLLQHLVVVGSHSQSYISVEQFTQLYPFLLRNSYQGSQHTQHRRDYFFVVFLIDDSRLLYKSIQTVNQPMQLLPNDAL